MTQADVDALYNRTPLPHEEGMLMGGDSRYRTYRRDERDWAELVGTIVGILVVVGIALAAAKAAGL